MRTEESGKLSLFQDIHEPQSEDEDKGIPDTEDKETEEKEKNRCCKKSRGKRELTRKLSSRKMHPSRNCLPENSKTY